MAVDIKQINCLDLLNNALKLDKRIKKGKEEAYNNHQNYKIAVLGSYSTQFFVSVLRYLLKEENIVVDIYEGDYNSINMEILDSSSELYKFKPNVVILLPYYSDISEKPYMFEDEKSISERVQKITDYYKKIWDKITTKLDCHILHSNFVIPVLRQLGALESNYTFSFTHLLKRINLELEKQHPSNVNIIDLDFLVSCIGKDQWFDYSSFYMSKMVFKMDYIKPVVELFSNQIKALFGKVNKCLILDLDNTLWGGEVGDLGYDGIILDPNNAEGEAYLAFQRYILSLKDRGVILAVCSKNNLEAAQEPFEKNEYMLLHLNDIACFVANWDDKATNIKKIAATLNIGLDSMVFVDDNPAEREIIRQFLPEVEVIDLPEDVAEYAYVLEKENVFDWMQLTKDDTKRTEFYYDNQKRNDLELSYSDYEEYLKALKMKGKISELNEKNISRFVQLINKSNQFNLRTKRYRENEIRHILNDDNYRLLYVKISDRFSDYGLISCIILKKVNEICFIDTWLMSCRVLKRDIEKLVCERIINTAKEWGCSVVLGEYLPTAKNSMVKAMYPDMGFKIVTEEDDLNTHRTSDSGKLYYMDVNKKNDFKYYINILE